MGFLRPNGCLRDSCCLRWAILIPALPFCHAELLAEKPRSEHYPKEINSLGDHIRVRRLDLKLLQKKVAEQIGVNGATITSWERNASTPVIRYMPAIIRFIGYDPTPPPSSLPERLRSARRELGLTQRRMAERLGVDPSTVRDWEAGNHQPTKGSMDVIGRYLQNR
jgi:transcriptional regulator with XRE-family HTH domain